MLSVLAAGLVAGLGVAMPLGAIGAMLIGLPARAGHRVATAAALGVASTDGAYAAVAVLAGASVAAPLHHLARPLQAISAVVLVASAAWQLLLVGGGSAMAHVLTTPRGRRVLAYGSALLMLALAVRVASYALD